MTETEPPSPPAQAEIDRDYPVCHVAFIDILGFTNKILAIRNDGESFKEIEYLQNAIQIIVRQVLRPPAIIGFERIFGDIKSIAFSDCLVLSVEKGKGPLTYLIDAVISVCRVLISRGALPRGGVATGRLSHRGNVVFGEGQIRAFQLEQGAAKYPRVILDPVTVELWEDAMSELMLHRNREMVIRDDDGIHIVDIFHKTTLRDDSDFYRHSGEALQRMLNQPGVPLDAWAKMVWMAERFNAAASRIGFSPPVAIPARPIR